MYRLAGPTIAQKCLGPDVPEDVLHYKTNSSIECTGRHTQHQDSAADADRDWDDEYANAAHIADANRYLTAWPEQAARFRASLLATGRLTQTLDYGPAEREVMDLFHPEREPLGVAVIVHGGYWLRFDAATFSHLAAGAVARGWLVAMPSYPLCPDVSIADITCSISRAVAAAARQAPGPVCLAGHSAGGHLVTRQMCTDSPLSDELIARIDRVLSISGLHDLRPLMHTRMNEQLSLDMASAAAQSPALQVPHHSTRVIAWVGSAERPEFIRQNALLAHHWTKHGASMTTHIEPDKHHFDVIDDLQVADSPMMQAWLGH